MVSIQEEEKIPQEYEEACTYAMQLASTSVVPMTLKAAIELDLLEIIARAGVGAQLSPAEIAAQLPTQNPQAPVMVDRILRVLASYEIVTCSLVVAVEGGKVGRRYGLAPVCKFLAKNGDGVSMAPLVLMAQDKVLMESWYHLKDAVLEGGVAFNRAHGMGVFEYLPTDTRLSKLFNDGMSHSTVAGKKMLEVYGGGLEGIKVLVDVGGGVGTLLNIIISNHPTIKGINFDLPHVIAEVPPSPGVEHVGGDMFDSVPSGDAIFLKWILHDWSDEHCVKLLKNCRKALPKAGKVIVMESILPEAPETTNQAQRLFKLDLIMLANYPGGMERSASEYKYLAEQAGFSGFSKVCSACDNWIMEFTK